MILPNGATDVTTYFVLRDSTTHVPKTDVSVTDIDLYYLEQGAAMAAKVDVPEALAAADSAHADNKAFHCGQGLYRVDWPDEAFNGGIGKRAYLIVVCTGVDTEIHEVILSPPADAVAVSGDKEAADILELFVEALKSDTGQLDDGSFAAGAINAAAIAASAMDGKGNWNIGKTGYTVSSVSDKTGYGLSSAERTSLAAAIEAAIINELDGTAIMQAIADLIASDMTTTDLTVAAIATAVRDAILNRVLNGNHDIAGTPGYLIQNVNTSANTLLARIIGTLAAGNHTPQTGDSYALAAGATGFTAIDTVVDAIKAKTDNLPSDPADQSAVEAAVTSATSGLATAAALTALDTLVDRMAPLLIGTVAGAGSGTEVYAYGGVTATVTVDVDGNVSAVVFS